MGATHGSTGFCDGAEAGEAQPEGVLFSELVCLTRPGFRKFVPSNDCFDDALAPGLSLVIPSSECFDEPLEGLLP